PAIQGLSPLTNPANVPAAPATKPRPNAPHLLSHGPAARTSASPPIPPPANGKITRSGKNCPELSAEGILVLFRRSRARQRALLWQGGNNSGRCNSADYAVLVPLSPSYPPRLPHSRIVASDGSLIPYLRVIIN